MLLRSPQTLQKRRGDAPHSESRLRLRKTFRAQWRWMVGGAR